MKNIASYRRMLSLCKPVVTYQKENVRRTGGLVKRGMLDLTFLRPGGRGWSTGPASASIEPQEVAQTRNSWVGVIRSTTILFNPETILDVVRYSI